MATRTPSSREISPELVLVDPELAAWARSRLPRHPFEADLLTDPPRPRLGARFIRRARRRVRLSPEALAPAAIAALVVGAGSLLGFSRDAAPLEREAAPQSPRADRDGSRAVLGATFERENVARARRTRAQARRTRPARTTVTPADSPTVRKKQQPAERRRATRQPAPVTRAQAPTETTAERPQVRRQPTRGARPTVPEVRASVGEPVVGVSPRAHLVVTWKPLGEASYYNVVVIREGQRVLDLFPDEPRVVLPRQWVHEGRRRTLSPGRYEWFVYPGYGERSAVRYGRLLAGGTLIVPPKP